MGRAFSDIPGVEAVYAYPSGGTLRVFTVVDKDTDELLDRIHARERELMHSVADQIRFNVVFRNGRPMEDLFSAEYSPVWQKAVNSCRQPTNI